MHEPDFEQMKPYLEQAANQQHPEALFYLGNLYMESDVVERDFEMAKVCFEIAANQGHAKAMEKLVSLYLEQRLEPSFYQHVQRYVSPQPTRSPVYEEAVYEEAVQDTNWFDERPDGRAWYFY
jgi:TPR repeat protein